MTRLSILGALGRCLRDQTGSAAIEVALVVSTLSMIMLNGVEISRWYFARMQVQNATQMAAQAIWKTCDTSAKLPVTTNCSGRTIAITNALQSTSLGSGVALSTGYPTEAYYCVATSGGALTSVGAVSSTRPNSCSPTGPSSEKPADYVIVQAQYTFTPLFNGITIGSLMPTTVQASTTMRVQ
jgi:Flp pilus assembly protein TadG